MKFYKRDCKIIPWKKLSVLTSLKKKWVVMSLNLYSLKNWEALPKFLDQKLYRLGNMRKNSTFR